MFNFRLAAVCLAAASALMVGPSASMPTSASIRSPTDHPIARRRFQLPAFNNEDELLEWTEQHKAGLRAKYASKLQDSQKQETQAAEERRRKRSLLKRNSVGDSSLINYQHDSTFYSPVSIGTPGQSVNLVLDTGSSDMWTVQGKENWNPAQSSTFSNSTTAFKITYGSGSVSGTLASDTVTLAGQTANSQKFAIATYISQGLLGDAVEGIMGLGFPSLSTSKSTPFWQNVGANEFSFYLASDNSTDTSSYSDKAAGGTFTLGGRNTSLFKGDINWSDVIDESYWLITLGGVTVNNQDVNLEGTNKVAVDTGTTLIGAPGSIVDQIYSQVPNSQQMSTGYYTFPCAENKISATLHFGNQEYTLNSDDLIAGTVDATGTMCLGAFFSIGSTSKDELQYILGDAFLMNVYSIFSNSGKTAQVGFAALADGLGSSTASRTVNSVVAANAAIGAASMMTNYSFITLTFFVAFIITFMV